VRLSVHLNVIPRCLPSFLGFPLDDTMIKSTLRGILSARAAGHPIELNVLDDLYQSIQLLPSTHQLKLTFSTAVGDFYAIQSRQSQNQDALNKAIDIYAETLRNTPSNDTSTDIYAAYGTTLLERFENLRQVGDDSGRSSTSHSG
jgi:hypothetical protein